MKKRLFDTDFKKKEKRTTLFSRETVEKHFCIWADKNHIDRNRENFMAFLEMNGMLNIENVEKYLFSCGVDPSVYGKQLTEQKR